MLLLRAHGVAWYNRIQQGFIAYGFIDGINNIKGYMGFLRGYGYKSACEIFSDAGIKPPLMLLGTEEANKIEISAAESAA